MDRIQKVQARVDARREILRQEARRLKISAMIDLIGACVLIAAALAAAILL